MRSLVVLAIAAWLLVPSTRALADPANPNDEAELGPRITKLIEQLGSPQFEQRERAQAELQNLGLIAFDALHAAQNHDDIEIALRVRAIVRKLQVDWSREDDSVAVKRILKTYSEKDDTGRRSAMELLAQLDSGEGIPALCRLARFETRKGLPEVAALKVMNIEVQAKTERTRISTLVRKVVGNSSRVAASWLRAYADTLEDAKGSLATWDQLVQDELQRVGEIPDAARQKQIARELLYWNSQLLLAHGEDERANALLTRSFDFIEGNREELMQAADWLIGQESWDVVVLLSTRFAGEFDKHGELLYRLAESQLKLKKTEEANANVAKALALAPQDQQLHNTTAMYLQKRGLLDWAKKEYLLVMEIGPVGSYLDVYARLLLSEMLHDNGQDGEAADTLAPLVAAMDKDNKVEENIRKDFQRPPEEFRSRYQYFLALSEKDDPKKLMERLRQGIAADPFDVDVLIGMHRVPKSTDAWRKETVQKIEAAVVHFRQEVAKYETLLNRTRDPQTREGISRILATQNNQLAWLIGNTVGDYDEAIRCSHRSLELRPGSAAYLDTLGCCYFAKKDYANAVKYQKQAVKADPYSGLIKKQLAKFEQALADSNKE